MKHILLLVLACVMADFSTANGPKVPKFESLDRTDDGVVTADEVKFSCTLLRELDLEFVIYDKNGDGYIDKDEFDYLAGTIYGHDSEPDIFDRWEKDGLIGLGEIKSFLSFAKLLQDLFGTGLPANIDLNQDGALSNNDEFKKVEQYLTKQ